MKYPKVDAVWKTVHRCAINPEHSPVIQDLLYCGVMFVREAMKASFGNRPQSSSRIALDLAANRSKRLRLYRRMNQESLSPTTLPSSGRNHRNHV
jgi:hypothetical protein